MINVYSEIGKLRKVLVHTPGKFEHAKHDRCDHTRTKAWTPNNLDKFGDHKLTQLISLDIVNSFVFSHCKNSSKN